MMTDSWLLVGLRAVSLNAHVGRARDTVDAGMDNVPAGHDPGAGDVGEAVPNDRELPRLTGGERATSCGTKAKVMEAPDRPKRAHRGGAEDLATGQNGNGTAARIGLGQGD